MSRRSRHLRAQAHTTTAAGGCKFNPMVLSEIQNAGDMQGLLTLQGRRRGEAAAGNARAFIDMPPGETMPHRRNWELLSLTSERLGCSKVE
jgi:hypothetical protein